MEVLNFENASHLSFIDQAVFDSGLMKMLGFIPWFSDSKQVLRQTVYEVIKFIKEN